MERTIQNNRLVDGAKIDNLPEDTQGEITSLQSQITSNDSDISSLDSRVTTNEGNIAKKLNNKANGGTYIEGVTASGNITLDKTDPYNPIIGVTPGTGLGDVTLDGVQTIRNKTLENTSSVGFNTTAGVTVGEGEIAWNDEDGTLDVGMKGGNVTGQLFEELFIYAKAGEAITNGDVVYKSGVVVSKYIADGSIDPILVLGIATEDIAVGEFGFITTFGKIRGLDTSAYTEDTILYASPTTAGAYTNTRPTAPNLVVPIALVTYSHANNGVLSTEKRYLPKIEDLNGVQITSPTNGQALVYDGTKWVNGTIAGGVTSVNTQTGDVVLDTDDISEGVTNQYYTEDRVSANTDVAANTSARHTHTNKAILDATTASFTTAYETKLGGIDDNANNYSLPTASTTVLGGVKVDGTTITIDGSGVISSAGGGGKTKEITIPGELIADTSNYQGLFFYNDTGSSWTISNVSVIVAKAAAGTSADLSVNIYKSSGTASDGINTSATALFSSAITLGTSYTSLSNTPTTTTVEDGRWLSLRITNSAGATNKASDLKVIITYS